MGPPAESSPAPDARPDASASLRHRLPKAERLHLRDAVQGLFTQAKGFHQQELRVLYRLVPAATGQAPVQVLFGAPKRHFRRAHDRNRAKRLLREAYRQHKHALLQHMATRPDQHLHLAFLVNTRTMPTYAQVADRVQAALLRIQKYTS